MVEVRLRAVRVDLQSNTPVLLLQESEGLGRTLPIFIGAPEATAIAFALQGMDTPRPMTHDLIRDLLDALGAEVVRVVITELKTATYFAEIVLRHGNQENPVSSRPSDAVAVAVRAGAPLFVADDLMDSEGIMLAVDDEDDERGVRGGERQPRRAGRRVPDLPRLDPARGLLVLRRPRPRPGGPARPGCWSPPSSARPPPAVRRARPARRPSTRARRRRARAGRRRRRRGRRVPPRRRCRCPPPGAAPAGARPAACRAP